MSKIIIPSPLITRMSRDYRAGHEEGFAEGVIFGKATYDLALEKSKDKILEKIKSQLWIEIERDKDGFATDNFCLVFPTKEMRDAFFENFKELIEICKEFL